MGNKQTNWSLRNLHAGWRTDHKQSDKSIGSYYIVISARKRNKLSKGTENNGGAI